MKTLWIYRFTTLLIMILLCGCTSSATPTAEPSVILTKPDIASTLVSVTPTSSTTLTRTPARQIISSATITVQPTQAIQESALTIQSTLEIIPLQGRIVLEGNAFNELSQQASPAEKDTSYIWDLETDSKWQITTNEIQYIDFFAISPDRSLLACWIETTEGGFNFLRILDPNGQILIETAYPYSQFYWMIDWYDNEHLMFSKNTYPEYKRMLTPGPVVVMNPFTQEELTTLSSMDFPNVQINSRGIASWEVKYDSAQMVLSPDHQYAAYQQTDWRLGIYSYEERKQTASIELGRSDYNSPDWSLDGTFVIVDRVTKNNGTGKPQTEELFRLNTDGTVDQLTYLSTLFDKTEISNFKLSPDGTKIAFNLLTEKTEPDFQIAVADLESGQIVIYDNLISFHFNESASRRRPVWSPDGNQIMVVVPKEEDEWYRTVLIDLEKNLIIELAKDVQPVGWMLSE